MDYLMPFLKKSQGYFGKYGNPDIQILGTLKIKLGIFWFFIINNKNMISLF